MVRSAEMALVLVLLAMVLPGFGHAVLGRRTAMIAWIVAALVTGLAVIVSVWLVWAHVLVRMACGIDTFRIARRATINRWWGTLPAIALVVNVIAGGYLQLAVQSFRIPTTSMVPTIVIGDYIYADKVSLAWHEPERGEVIVLTHPCSGNTFVKRVIGAPGDTVEVRCDVLYVNGKAAPATQVAASTTYDDRDPDGKWFAKEVSEWKETLGGHTYDVFHNLGTPTHDFPSRERPFPPSCQQSGFYEQGPKIAQPSGTFVETKPASSAQACEPQLHFVVPAASYFVMGDNRGNANDSRYWGVVPRSAVIGRAIGVYMSNGKNGAAWGRIGAIR